MLRTDHKPQSPPRTDRREHIQPKPLTCGRHNGGLAPYPPRRAAMLRTADARLITEIDLSSGVMRLALDRRIGLVQPLLNPRRVLLIGPPQRLLYTQPPRSQPPADRGVTGPYAQFALHHLPHDGPRP